ncbi:MAG: GNAT family N-acetyltransferase [Acidobacteriia bacterium]|nr:GNAT family N-acetyltransferase [Terriglobia bacterium]
MARTYGYEPFVLTSGSPGKPLTDGVALCRVSSWITGNRAVSLPFSDHCEPLIDNDAGCSAFANFLRTECDRHEWRYVELRPLSWNWDSDPQLRRSHTYCFHSLDLTRPVEQIFSRLHKDSLQRRIRRAERSHLSYDTGRSEHMVNEFYKLLLITRRRHELFPQPRAWFQNLVECMGDKVQIRLARKDGVPIAAILSLRHGYSVVYKYGCSDEKLHRLAAMPFLFWRLIEESKASGIEQIDFGRSDMDNAGLIAFKDRFGTRKQLLTYFRYSQTESRKPANWTSQATRQMVALLPDAALSAVGRVVYRHMG